MANMPDLNEDLDYNSLSCPICLEIAAYENAVETNCCHQIYCEPCLKNIRTCPSCRFENVTFTPAYFARRLIGSLKVPCSLEGCNMKIARSDLNDHVKRFCQYRGKVCPDSSCDKKMFEDSDFLTHLISQHRQLLLKQYKTLWSKTENLDAGVIVSGTIQSELPRAGSAVCSGTSNIDPIRETKNRFGRSARLGSNGKFYCGGNLDGPKCNCCNGKCGPTNGCNCSACMLLDVEKRNLSRSWLVNCEGASARCSSQNPETFYCGRLVMKHDPRTDGYCGPDNGPQCHACEKLNMQVNRRYHNVWAQSEF